MTITDTTRAARPPAGRSLPRKTRVDFWLDLVLFVAFTLDYSFRFTGLTIHEWVGIAFGVALPVHLTLHWDWVVRTTKRLTTTRGGRETLRWIIDILFLPTMVLCVVSGVLISRSALPALGIDTTRDSFWTGLHTTSADFTVALTALHIGLNWRWIVTTSKRIVRRGNAR